MPNTRTGLFLVAQFVVLWLIVQPNRPFAQDAHMEPKVVTLEARQQEGGLDNYARAAFSFLYGINGDEAVKLTRNDWDILYGNITLNGDKDWLEVTLVRDDRSRIKDLGELSWSDSIQIPVLPACSEGEELCTGIVFPSTASGKSLTDVNANVAKPLVGHMYLVHTKDRDKDFYTLFRVEALRNNQSCTISWKPVPSPE